jgi:ribosomal protein S18 acetylase RimI-like enzyme
MGTVAMLVSEPDLDPEVVSALIQQAEHYLRSRGAKVIYGGTLFPLNPFYWGLYGGSEGSGVLASHEQFHSALRARRYEPVSTIELLEADLSVSEPRDPRAALLRRQAQVEFSDDALPAHWWEGASLAEAQVMRARLLSRTDGTELAHADTWDMGWFGRADGRARIGLVNLEVSPEHRRRGCGHFLVSEIFRRARENLIAFVATQTASTNKPALALYAKLGFKPLEQATLYRQPLHLADHDAPA